MHATQLATIDVQVARHSGADAQHDGVEVPPQGLRIHIRAHIGAALEFDA